ncbi:unnamed protein product [Porites evermanni]|uniref:Uncharacterized protein n=1 Tax=Porites evermanni TaxID=104178 RepID=A0ABN8MC44_9CNID|nr:unnamed protein product [Porites evermanni]
MPQKDWTRTFMSQEPLLSSVMSNATERLDKDLHVPRASVIFSHIRCHRKAGQGLSRAKSLCYLQYCMCSMFCFVIQLLSEPDCGPGVSKFD